MTVETLKRLLNEACELLMIFEDGNTVTNADKIRINAIFDEVRYLNGLEIFLTQEDLQNESDLNGLENQTYEG